MRNAASLGKFGMILVLAATTSLRSSRATIYQWEYVNPGDPSQGKQQSTNPTPGGLNRNAVPGANLGGVDLTLAYLIGANVQGASFVTSKLTLADLTNANAANANFGSVTWTGATLTGATIRGTYLSEATAHGLTAAQFYSTGSYQSGDLTGIRFRYNDLFGWNFAGKNLTGAELTGGTNLANANLSDANLTNANLEGAPMTNANFSNATLVNANLEQIVATDANFTGADIRGAKFRGDTATRFASAQLYSTASYQTGDLSGISFNFSDLSGWNFAGKNLTNASFGNTTLTSANFANANIQGAGFAAGGVYGGISLSQFTSTASYQTRNLQGIRLTLIPPNSSWDFFGQNLTGAYLSGTFAGSDFRNAILVNARISGSVANANFSGADVRGADFDQLYSGQLYSTKNYQEHDLTGINFSGQNVALWDFTNQNLTNVDFSGAFLSDAIFTGAKLRGTNFSGAHAVTPAQIYSTASYQSGDMVAVNFGFELVDWNFADKDLSQANFGALTLVNFQRAKLIDASFSGMTNVNFGHADLTGADFSNDIANTTFSNANLVNASFPSAVDFTNVNFTGADARGASISKLASLSAQATTNMIRPDGHVKGLTLTQSNSLTVRNYVGPNNAPIPIRVEQHFLADSTGVLQTLLDEDPWRSTISFDPGIPVALGGTLQLDFAPDVDVGSQIGRTFRLFDWGGVTPSGAFAISSYYLWDTSHLYLNGEVTFTGTYDTDFNQDGAVDGSDFLDWQRNVGGPNSARDLANWEVNFGQTAGGPAAQVPEPAAALVATGLLAPVVLGRSRFRRI